MSKRAGGNRLAAIPPSNFHYKEKGMSDELLGKVKSQQAEVREQFEALDKKRQEVTEKRANLDRELAEINTEQLRLQGEYRSLEKLLKGTEPEKEPTVH